MSIVSPVKSILAENIRPKVIVIGAGLAGLTAAYRLQQEGMDVDLYEARNRVGGRVLTVNVDGNIIELGAQTFTDPKKYVHLCRLIDELGLEITESRANLNYSYFNGENLISVNQHLKKMQYQPQILSSQITDLVSKSCNMKEVLDQILDENDPLYKVMSIKLAIYEGASIEKLSTHYIETLISMLTEVYEKNEEDNYKNRSSIKGGNGLLPEGLAKKLGTRLHLDMRLNQVSKNENNIFTLIFNENQKVEADILVLAVPCSVYDDIIFEENVIPLERLKNIQSVKYGTNSKIVIPLSNIPSKTTGLISDEIFSNLDILQNVLIMHFTDEMNLCFNKTILNICAKAKPMIEMGFGDIAFKAPIWANDQSFAAYDVPVGYSWPNDPYAKGSYSYISPGQETLLTAMIEETGENFKSLFAPIEQKLYFAGEHVSILMEVPGTMEAACESGERIARTILKNRQNEIFSLPSSQRKTNSWEEPAKDDIAKYGKGELL